MDSSAWMFKGGLCGYAISTEISFLAPLSGFLYRYPGNQADRTYNYSLKLSTMYVNLGARKIKFEMFNRTL